MIVAPSITVYDSRELASFFLTLLYDQPISGEPPTVGNLDVSCVLDSQVAKSLVVV